MTEMRRPRIVAWLATIVWLVAIGLLTLIPDPMARGSAAGPLCWYCDSYATLDVALNIALFLPLGIALKRLGWSWQRLLLTTLGLATLIEVLQLELVGGRDASIRDLLANTAGAGFGAWVSSAWRPTLHASSALARSLVRVGALVLLAVLGFVSWCWRPNFPRSQYFGQWAPDRGQESVFAGQILSATAGGQAAPGGGPLDSSVAVRDRLLVTGGRLTTRMVTSRATKSAAPIVAIFDDERRMIAELAQVGESVTFDLRQNADAVRLRKPMARLETGVLLDSGATVEIEGKYEHGEMMISATGAYGAVRHVSQLTPALGWTLLMPFSPALGASASLISALWLSLLLLPLGYWQGRARSGGLWLAVALVGGLTLLPLALSTGMAGVGDWAGALAGVLLGSVAGRRALPRSA